MAADFSFGIDLAVGDAQGVAGASCASWLRGCLGGLSTIPFSVIRYCLDHATLNS